MNDSTARPSGYYGKIATIWLRLMALLLVFYALISVVYLMLWKLPEISSEPSTGPSLWLGAALYGLGGLVLWVLSAPLGRLVARGVDDAEPRPPAA
jgi:hypothetical protein